MRRIRVGRAERGGAGALVAKSEGTGRLTVSLGKGVRLQDLKLDHCVPSSTVTLVTLVRIGR
jgi:hypothetical protein